jgi:hypothetical protein
MKSQDEYRMLIRKWAKELTTILEGHFEIASSDNLQNCEADQGNGECRQ